VEEEEEKRRMTLVHWEVAREDWDQGGEVPRGLSLLLHGYQVLDKDKANNQEKSQRGIREHYLYVRDSYSVR
jgi:hypothetical protein